ncbi:vWA domain-containing protein [Tundrisphaera lichenicola]|uniref:vWA domain-containing protein n=1 Tax=Tundrisphaera lichenicola TaxID=2029860 RepID=UPI003EBF19C4
MTRLAEPAWLALTLLILIPWLRSRWRPRLAWPTLSGFEGVRSRSPRILGAIPGLARALAIACLAVAMARPQEPGGQIRVAGRGVAIMAVLDRSPSMSEADFPSEEGPISRLEAAKKTLARFIQARADDLVGVVQFANHPDILATPRLDQGFLLDATRSIRPAGVGDVGTSLGDAVIEGLGALRGASTRRKVLILLTDGRDEPAVPRPTPPIIAAELARDLGVTLHAIAVGRPVEDPEKPEPAPEGPDLALLRSMAEVGGGRLFEAADAESLGRVFEEIDTLERSPVVGTIRTIYRERFAPWASAGLGLLAFDLILSRGRLRRLP